MNTLTALLGTTHPLIQAPMAGAQGAALAIAVSNAGGLGSLPGAMLTPEALRTELVSLSGGTQRPWNVNFFCHTPPVPDAAQTSRASQSTAYPQSVAATHFANGDKNGQIHDSRPGGRADP